MVSTISTLYNKTTVTVKNIGCVYGFLLLTLRGWLIRMGRISREVHIVEKTLFDDHVKN